jgi:hypothetical protein
MVTANCQQLQESGVVRNSQEVSVSFVIKKVKGIMKSKSAILRAKMLDFA